MKRHYIRTFVSALAIGFAFVSSAVCQQPDHTQHKHESGTAAQKPQIPAGSTIRTQSVEVLAPVVATDKKGELLLDLTEHDFKIFDDGIKEPIEYFGIGSERLSIALIVESSGRVTPLLPDIHKAGIVFAQPVKGQNGEAAIVAYDSKVRTLLDFTSESEALEKTIENVTAGDTGAYLYDAMRSGISLLESRPIGQRRVLLVMGESLDTGSESKLGEVLRQAETANVTIYSVGLSTTTAVWRTPSPKNSGPAPLPTVATGNIRDDELTRARERGADLTGLAVWLVQTGKTAMGPNVLAVACKSTGGMHFPSKDGPTIEEALDSIGGEIHAQYVVGYLPSVNKAVGFHSIRVTVDRSGVVIRTRPGYYVNPPSK